MPEADFLLCLGSPNLQNVSQYQLPPVVTEKVPSRLPDNYCCRKPPLLHHASSHNNGCCKDCNVCAGFRTFPGRVANHSHLYMPSNHSLLISKSQVNFVSVWMGLKLCQGLGHRLGVILLGDCHETLDPAQSRSRQPPPQLCGFISVHLS